jgi:predicted nucleotidyltransferase
MHSLDSLAAEMGAILASFGRVRAAFLFGSRVDGTVRKDSDLDLAVAFDPETSEQERVRMKLDMIDAATAVLGVLGERLDIADLETANSAVAFRAVRDGIQVYQRTRSDRVDVVARVCARAADDAYHRARSAEITKTRLLGDAKARSHD